METFKSDPVMALEHRLPDSRSRVTRSSCYISAADELYSSIGALALLHATGPYHLP
jgi:hypothetical protein